MAALQCEQVEKRSRGSRKSPTPASRFKMNTDGYVMHGAANKMPELPNFVHGVSEGHTSPFVKMRAC